MEHHEVWASLERIFNMTPRERYEDEAYDLHRTCVRAVEKIHKNSARLKTA